MSNPNLLTLRQKAQSLGLVPGVYLMKDAQGKVLYVGKARALKTRVSQYFAAAGTRDEMDAALVERVIDFDYITTSSEHEALVLECSLIKQHSPKYNILLKDGKGYRYIRVTKDAWPRLDIVHKKNDDSSEYLGPFTSSHAMKLAVEEVRQIFQLPVCSRKFPRDIGKGRPCLQFFIERCSAPCARKIGQGAYAQSVREAVNFLKKGSSGYEKEIRQKMEIASEKLQFELAAKLRDKLRAIEKMRQKQHVVSVSTERQDVFALAAEETRAVWMVLRFSAGALRDSEQFSIPRPSNFARARQELIERYYTLRFQNLPKKILLDGEIENAPLLELWLSERENRKVSVQVAQKGEPLRLVELCHQNALEHLAQRTGRQSKSIIALEELGKMLNISPPSTIEAYDISHSAGADNVAGMVVFQDGAPLKNAYKRFAIKGFAGQDDYASLAETLQRRLARAQKTTEQVNFGKLPDLILLDGGIGQVHAVDAVLREMNFQIPVFGMVKDGKHKTRAIASNGGELSFRENSAAFALVTTIQEEVHRFAVAYHHKKHQKRSLSSELLEIPGIGKARAEALFRAFRTIQAIRTATVEELANTEGMNRTSANSVVNFFSK